VSKFAGTVSSSGKVGHVIISNPNGIVIEKGAKFVTPGGLTLNGGNLEIKEATIKTTKGAVNLDGTGITLDGTKVTSRDGLYLYSTDGVNFVNKVTAGTIIAKSDTEFSGVKVAAIKTEGDINNITIKDNSVIKGTKKAQTDIKADNVTIENSKITGVAKAKAKIEANEIEVTDGSIISNSNINPFHLNISNSTIKTTSMYIKNNSFNNSSISASVLDKVDIFGGYTHLSINNSAIKNIQINEIASSISNSSFTGKNNISSLYGITLDKPVIVKGTTTLTMFNGGYDTVPLIVKLQKINIIYGNPNSFIDYRINLYNAG
jgi:hypothetical protein